MQANPLSQAPESVQASPTFFSFLQMGLPLSSQYSSFPQAGLQLVLDLSSVHSWRMQKLAKVLELNLSQSG
jgi:hypothetical protein